MIHARRSLPRWSQQWWIWFTAIFAITFLSFWPSFFSAIVNIETHIVIHGISAIAWMLLTITQALLIKSGWRRHHRTVGYISISLAAVLVLSGLQVIQTMLFGDGGTADGIALLSVKFFYIDFTALVLFCVFLGLAIKAARRRDIPLHLRLIACTAIIPLEAALERLPEVTRAVVWLHDVEGYTHNEIAEQMGKSVSFSKSQLSRAHVRLRRWLGGEAA